MAKVSLTNGDILDVWVEEQAKAPNQQLSVGAICRQVLSTLDLVADFAQSKVWTNAVAAATRRLTKLVATYKNAMKSGKRKQVVRDEVGL